MELPSFTTTLTAIFFIIISRFIIKLYKARSPIYVLSKQGLVYSGQSDQKMKDRMLIYFKPMPPWNPLFGHLYFCYRIASKLPKDAHPNYLPDMIRRTLPDLGPLYYLDPWPFGPQMLVVASTRGLHQITQEHSLPKYHALKYFLKPISEGMDIVTMEGDLWRTWRAIFNPGFSASHLMSQTRNIVEETHHFCDILQNHSKNHTFFKMKDLTDNLTMDIIGKIVLYGSLME